MPQFPARLRAAGIGEARYAELKAICLGYPQLQRELRRARAGIVDKRRSSGAWRQPDPTGAEAVSLADHPAAKRLRLIESTAQAVGGKAISPALLESVTTGRHYDQLRHRPPLSINAFYRLRVDFFIALDAALWASV